jgi:hypothetical protein
LIISAEEAHKSILGKEENYHQQKNHAPADNPYHHRNGGEGKAPAAAGIATAHDRFAPAYAAAVTAARQDYTQPASATVIALAQTVVDLVTKYAPPK